jgi:rhomboid protease GluP
MDQRQWQTRAENGPQAQPEILPPGNVPDYRYQQPMAEPPPRRRRSGWQLAPATYVLTGINIAVYVLMIVNGVSPTAPTGEQLVHWGANVGLFVLADHQWWRLVTSTFVHSGIIHIATNMWCLTTWVFWASR